MPNAEEFSGQWSDLTGMPPAYRRPGSRFSQIRYAHKGARPRVEPFCAVSHGPASHHGDAGEGADGRDRADGRDSGTAGAGGAPGEFPAAHRHTDLWVLVCGGIAAAAAFAAAFVASGGVSSHPAAPGATMPAVVSQACPSPAAGPTP